MPNTLQESAKVSLIPPSSNYNTNFSNFLQTDQVIVGSLTDGTAILSGGILSNLTNGPDPQDAVNKSFVTGTANPGGLVNNVQFNEGGTFGGTNAFTWSSPTLTVSGKIEDATGAYLSGGFASSLLGPVLPQDIATKGYVDSFGSTLTSTDILSNLGVQYTSSQMVGAIRRDMATYTTGLTVTDTTTDAADIIIDNGLGLGSTFTFILTNDITDGTLQFNGSDFSADSFKVILNSGVGITFDPPGPHVFHRAYIMKARALVTNIGSGTEAIKIIIDSFGTPASLSLVPLFTPLNAVKEESTWYSIYDMQSYLGVKIQKNLLFPTSDTIVAGAPDYTYTIADIKNSVIIRNPLGIASDDFVPYTDGDIGSTFLTIMNISVNDITLTADTTWNHGVGFGPLTIPGNKTAYLSFSPASTGIFTNPAAYINSIGIFNHNN
jgi:hypothetical protein